ncbi:MAG: polymer-forming cytoskeletal protein [Lachnospiraceae bacterium]|nr:polymer-forming cytoskeletal protein [Lachnospiraceae bacterium]
MGFFSDLKEDLSQAVNELMPEEELEAALAAEGAQEKPVNNVSEKTAENIFSAKELSDMLDKVETIGNVNEPVGVEPKVTTVQSQAVQQHKEESGMEAKKSFREKRGEEKKMEFQATKMMTDETAIVTAGMAITGDISSGGSLELIGTVRGNIDILGKLNITGVIEGNSKAAEIYAEGAKVTGEINSQGSVKIGQSSVVIGNIFATSAVIAGAVKGDIDVKGPVILDTSAIVMGNIKSKSVQINNGAVIEGMCSQCYADVNPTSFFDEIKKKK